MLTLVIEPTELYDENTGCFLYTDAKTIHLEHSLISISKWEAKYHKAYMSNRDKSEDEALYYVQCMCLDKNVDPIAFTLLTQEHFAQIKEYIEDKHSATYIPEKEGGHGPNTPVTSELVYYWMISYNIPFECEKWHLNKLLALIDVCEIKNSPNKKMSPAALAKRNSALNRQRLNKYHTKG